MYWSVYIDLTRPLNAGEQDVVINAVDQLVPGSGCLGPDGAGRYEVYFRVDAPSLEQAQVEATHYMDLVLQHAGVSVAYAVAVQPSTP